MADASTSSTREIAGGHLLERFRLFFIIALGETVLTTGTAFTGEPFELERLLALAIGFTGTVALWWCYFQRSEAIGVEVAETAEDAGAVGCWGTWTLTLMVLALIAHRRRRRARDRPSRRRRDRSASRSSRSAGRRCSCSPRSSSLHEAFGHVPRSRPLALAALAILAVATAPLTLIAGIAAASAVLVAVAIADTVRQPASR